jgi:hypothetical protein
MALLLMMVLTVTRQWRKPSETIWPATVATRDALWPEERSARAKMAAAPSKELKKCCLSDTKQLTSSNDVTKNRMRTVNIGSGDLNTRLVEDGTR